MSTFTIILLLIVMMLVVLVLGRGLVNMMRGGSGNVSNRLMQARIGLQALAIVLIMLTLWIVQNGH
ncbi:twin transmembrane helix small protein [Martelella alba]|uniref:Twin transmembrane helix small protein n=1 Tax=Martelella alba TaxID=2590451 RepID=A0A506UDN6_9HYPH|nr:twin transmembrane helix small protein [Martelella alba]TPW31064.1 twin transmembrane helix small protein [Martelella alba]